MTLGFVLNVAVALVATMGHSTEREKQRLFCDTTMTDSAVSPCKNLRLTITLNLATSKMAWTSFMSSHVSGQQIAASTISSCTESKQSIFPTWQHWVAGSRLHASIQAHASSLVSMAMLARHKLMKEKMSPTSADIVGQVRLPGWSIIL